jgi:hypothetical protein
MSPSAIRSVTPWWDALRLRQEVLDSEGSIDDVQMSLYQAAYGTGAERPLYADPGYYGEITHPSPQFIDLMAKVAVRLGGGDKYTAAPALTRLDQAMGGGKSHGLIGLYHLAEHSEALAGTDVGSKALVEAAKIVGHAIPGDMGNPKVVILACDNMTAGQSVYDLDGPAVSLYERFLWRLFSGDRALYDRYQPHHGDKSKIVDALKAVNRPVLILVDEIMDYIRQLSDTQHHDLATKDMAFLRALLDSVNDVPHVAMVVVMIASDKDSMALDEDGQARRAELDSLLVRNGKPATINDNADFAAILRRRLFEVAPPAEVLTATSELFKRSMTGPWKTKVFDALGQPSWVRQFNEEVARCYPFHPQLIQLAEQEWAKLAGYQRVRSTIRIFAATVFTLAKRAQGDQWTPLLIGSGDLPLSNEAVREAVIGSGLISDTRTQANYRSLASADIVAPDDEKGSARILDLSRSRVLYADVNPRPAERGATCLFLCSVVGSRSGGKQGATEPEIRAAMFVPDRAFGLADADAVLAELKDVDGGGLASLEEIAGKGGQSPRLFMSTRQTLNMLFRASRGTIVDEERDEEVSRTAERLLSTGPFKSPVIVSADPSRSPREVLATAGIDNARTTRLVLLDSRQFSLLNGIDTDTRGAIRAAMGIGPEKLPVQWASSSVFAVVNTQKRGVARGQALIYLAWDRVAGLDQVKSDDELREKAADERQKARKNLETAVKRAYQHIAYLDLGDDAAGDPRVDRIITLEEENQTSLDGTTVWKKLVEVQKVFEEGKLNSTALVHNLRDDDYGRPLDEVRDLFWNSPRMPLLPKGDADLQRAIFEAIGEGKLLLVGADGTERPVVHPSEIGVGLSSLKLARPVPTGVCPACGGLLHPGQPCPEIDPAAREALQKAAATSGTAAFETLTGSVAHGEATPTLLTPLHEKQFAFSLRTSLSDDERQDALYSLLTALGASVDNGDASYAEVMVKMRIKGDMLEDLSGKVRAAGTEPTITDV